MFYLFREDIDGKDKYGRTREKALEDHAIWCLNTLVRNLPDEEAIKNEWEKSPSWLVCPDEFKDYFAGDAAFNAYCEIKSHLDILKEFYKPVEMAWINNWMNKKS